VEGVDEKGIDKSTGKVLIEVDPRYFRPAEVDLLLGDPTKAKDKLGWEAEVSQQGLVSIMVKLCGILQNPMVLPGSCWMFLC